MIQFRIIEFTFGLAVRWIFKEGERELFVGKANVKENQPGRRVIYDYVLDREPHKELFLLETLDSYEATIGEVSSDYLFKEDPVLVLGQARSI